MKNILITGANRGLGLGFAKKCLKKNVNVLATVRDIKGSKELFALKERFPDNLEIKGDYNVGHYTTNYLYLKHKI